MALGAKNKLLWYTNRFVTITSSKNNFGVIWGLKVENGPKSLRKIFSWVSTLKHENRDFAEVTQAVPD